MVEKERRKRRWGEAESSSTTNNTSNVNSTTSAPMDAKAKAAALKQSVAARLAALKAKKAKTVSAAVIPPAPSVPKSKPLPERPRAYTNNDDEPKSKKAKVYDLDLSITAPTYNKPEEKIPVKKINPYLAHLETDEPTPKDGEKETKVITASLSKSVALPSAKADADIILDERLAGGQVVKRRRKKELSFVQPGTFIERAERKRAKVQNATESGFMSGRKAGTFVKSAKFADISKEGENGSNYYGHTSMETMDDFSTLAKRIPRVDTVLESVDGSSKSTGGVVVVPTPLVMEWWDLELVPSKVKKEVVALEGKAVARKASQRMKLRKSKNKGSDIEKDGDESNAEKAQQEEQYKLIEQCFQEAAIKNSKTHSLIQHPVPVKPPNAKEDAPAPTLHLTKKEMKRQRKLRRAEKQRELQDMQAAGLIPAPEPKLTLSNFMRVLGDQAVMDPSKMEAKVMEQIQARKLKHEKMNAERKLTKEQRSEKRDRKLTEDTSEAVSVALFLVKDMSHRYHRTKVDLNAQQNKITGGVLECENPKMSLVICEGGPKAIKRFTRLMLHRMKWTGEGVMDIHESDDEGDEQEGEEKPKAQKFNTENTCELVWTGMALKRMFRTFVFQACETSEDARRVLEAKNVAHFWDQVLVHASGAGETFNFKLG